MDKFERLKNIADSFSMDVSRETFERFNIYSDLLIEWNQKMNLTAITDPNEIFEKHFIDSISIFQLKEVKESVSIIDVGTGAGFPGLPMRIFKEDIELTLLDPLNKRLIFIKEVLDRTGISNVVLIHGRAEDVSRETIHRDRYDLAVSRAVANFPILAEYCLPFVKKNGNFVAMKGPGIHDELRLNEDILTRLNAELKGIITADYDTDLQHNMVLVQKKRITPEKYPRKNALIKKDSDRYKLVIEKLRTEDSKIENPKTENSNPEK